MAILDATFLIDVERSIAAALRLRERLHVERQILRVPAAAWTEFLHVIPPARRGAAAAELDSVARFEAYDRHLADLGASLQYDLRRAGEPLGWHDLQLAATALHYGEPIVSRDQAFDRIPGLVRLRY